MAIFKNFKNNMEAMGDLAEGFGELADKLNEKLEQRFELTYVDGHPELPGNIHVLVVMERDPLLIVHGAQVLTKVRKNNILGLRMERIDGSGQNEGGLGGMLKSLFTRKREVIILTVQRGKKTLELRFTGKKLKEKLLKIKKFAGV